MFEIPTYDRHPLKAEIKKRRLKLWQIQKMLGGTPSDATLSKMLNGIIPMSKEVEKGLRQIFDNINQSQGQQQVATAADKLR